MAEPRLATVEDLLGPQEATVDDLLDPTFQGGDAEDWQSESDKFTDELDVQAVIDARNAAQRTLEREQKTLDGILNTTGPSISIDGTPFNIQQALDSGASPTQILNTIETGNLIRTDIDNSLESGLRQVSYGLTNFLGMPGDIVGATGSAIEGLGRKGINLAAEATGNIDYTVSENPQDFTFTSPNPILGGQWIRDTLEKMGYDYPSIDQYPEDQKVFGQFGRVVGESAGLARAPFTLAKMGLGESIPLVKNAMKDPKKFAIQEGRAIFGGALGAGTLEYVDTFDDNPWAMAGAEVVGSILAANTSETFKALTTTPRFAYEGFMQYVAPYFSEEASKRRAVHHIFKSAATARQDILKEIEVLKKTDEVDQSVIDELISQADAFTPERMISDLTTGMESVASGNLPAGTLSENDALLAIQRRMMGDSKEYSDKIMERVNGTLESMLRASDLLARAGNAEGADILRKKYFQDAVNITIANKQADVAERMKAFEGRDNFRASQLAQSTLFEAKKNMRKMETYLWDRIDKDTPIAGTNIANSIRKINEEDLLDGMTIAGGGQIDAAINIIVDKIQREVPLSAGEVLKFRSIMLEQSRRAAGADDYGQAGIFDALATAAVDDLSKLDGAAGDTISLARAFSSELNQRFTRYFPKDVLSKEAKGGTSIEPEMVLDTGFGSGGDQAALNFQRLRTASTDATTFADDINNLKARDEAEVKETPTEVNLPSTKVDPSMRGKPTDDEIISEVQVSGRGPMVGKDTTYFDVPSDPNNPIPDYTVYEAEGANAPKQDGTAAAKDPEEIITSVPARTDVEGDVRQDLGAQMFNAQEDFLRSTVYKLRDSTGQISASQIDEFVLSNPRLLKDFPNLKADLDAYADAERTASEIMARLQKASTSDRLPDAIKDTLTSDNPADNFAILANEAQGIPDAMIDFRMATMDLLFQASRSADGSPDFIKLANNMGKPLSGRTGDITILDLMLDNNVISQPELDAMSELITEGLRIQRTTQGAGVFDQVVQSTPGFTKNAARIIGANLGVMFGRGDASLQAAAIGSEFVKNLVDKLPMARDAKNIEILMSTPSLLLEMMQKNPLRQRTAFQTGKELLAKYQGLGLTKKQMALELGKEGVVRAGDRVTDKTSAATYGALTTAEDEEPPEVRSLDQQMMNLE